MPRSILGLIPNQSARHGNHKTDVVVLQTYAYKTASARATTSTSWYLYVSISSLSNIPSYNLKCEKTQATSTSWYLYVIISSLFNIPLISNVRRLIVFKSIYSKKLNLKTEVIMSNQQTYTCLVEA